MQKHRKMNLVLFFQNSEYARFSEAAGSVQFYERTPVLNSAERRFRERDLINTDTPFSKLSRPTSDPANPCSISFEKKLVKQCKVT